MTQDVRSRTILPIGPRTRISMRAFFGCLSCLSLFCGGPARADEKAGLYLEGGTSLYVLERPQYAPLVAFNVVDGSRGTRIAVCDDRVEGPLATLTLGMRTASPFFFELTGRYFTDTARSNGAYSTSAYGTARVGYFSLTGNKTANGTTDTAITNVQARFSEYGARLLGGYAIDLGDDLTVSPLVGYEFMRIGQKYDMDYRTTTGGSMLREEDVGARYHGMLVGVRLRGQWGDYRASLTGSATGYLVRSGYDGAFDSNAWGDSASFVDSATAAGLEVSADLSRSWGPWSAGIHAMVRDLSYMPEIVASTKSTTLSLDGARPVHLTGSRSLGYAFGFKLSYSF